MFSAYQSKTVWINASSRNDFLRECFTRFLCGAEKINFTDDMGIENLRAYK